MTVETHLPTASVPESFADVDAYLRRLLANFEFDLEPEVVQSIGTEAAKRSITRVALLRDLIAWLEPAVEAEAADREQATSEDSVEQQFRRAYGDEPIAPYQAEGR